MNLINIYFTFHINKYQMIWQQVFYSLSTYYYLDLDLVVCFWFVKFGSAVFVGVGAGDSDSIER